MLPAQNRLKKRDDFSEVHNKGAYTSFNGIAIKYLETSEPDTLIGFPVGKNFSNKAVMRNRTRRILSSATMEHLPSLKAGFHIIIMIQGKGRVLDPDETADSLKRLFKKANLLM